MAKDIAGNSEPSEDSARELGPQHAGPVRNSGGDDRIAAEDAEYVSEREALKKARDDESPDPSGGDGADAHGNLHYGSPGQGGEIGGAAPAQAGLAAGGAASAAVTGERAASTAAEGALRQDQRNAFGGDEQRAAENRDVGIRRDASAHLEVSTRNEGVGSAGVDHKASAAFDAAQSEGGAATEMASRQAFFTRDGNDGAGEDGEGNGGAETGGDGGETGGGGDGDGDRDGDGDTVDTPVNTAPTGLALSTASVDENAVGAEIGVLSAFDPDSGDALTYALVDDASGMFEIVGDVLRLKEGATLDFETGDSYDISVSVTDASGASDIRSFTVAVNDVNEGPDSLSLSAAAVAENAAGADIGILSAFDPDAGDTLTYAISDDASGLFEIVGDALRLKDGAALDFEAGGAHEIAIAVTDASGAMQIQTFTIIVNDVNEAPTGLSLSALSIDENSDGGVVGALTVTDPDAGDAFSFVVSDNRFEVVDGQLKLKDGVSFDAETLSSIDLTVTATDVGGLAFAQNFAISVVDVNEAPSLSVVTGAGLQASYFNVGHAISKLSDVNFDATPTATGVVDSLNYMQGQEQFWEGAPNDYFAAKYEGYLAVEHGGSYTFNMASDDGSQLFIDGALVIGNDGLHGTQTRSVTLNLDGGQHALEIRYFENGGGATLQLAWAGPDTGGAMQVISGDAYQQGPSQGNLTLPEDTAGAVVAELAITDPDAGDTHSFAVSDDRFEVVDHDGALILKLKDGVSVDYETETSLDVSVTVIDAGGASSTTVFSIGVKDTNAAPEMAISGGEGLKASYFNIGHSLSNLSEIDFDAAPTATGVVGSINYMQGQELFWAGAPGDYFAAKYEGQILVDSGGAYTFSMASDDGSQLYIDGVLVLGNDGLHSTQTRTVSLNLSEGAHDIEVRYFENGGEQTLQLSWAGPDTGNIMQVMGGEDFRVPGFTDADRLGLTENVQGDVAALLSVTDAQGDDFSFAVSDDRFEVVETQAGFALKLKAGVSVDHESGSAIDVTVTATDSHGESSAMDLSIPVGNVYEAPTDFKLTPAPQGVLALNVDGGTDDVAIAANMEGFPTDALTVEVSFASSQANVGGGAPLFSYAANDGSDNEALLFLEGSSGKLSVYLAGQQFRTSIANADLLDGEQHQVSFTWDQATNKLKVYVDGALEYETSVNIRDLKSGGTLALGQEQETEGGKFDKSQVFQGEISEVRIFDYARDGSEIAGHANAPIANPDSEPGLVNNWVMDNETDGVIIDLVGADNMALSNGAAIVDGASFDVPTVFENQAGAVVGELSAAHPFTGEPITAFEIVDDPSGAFEIVGSQLKLKDGIALDHEAAGSYDVVVRANGAGGEYADQTVTVQVANIEESPVAFSFDPEATTGALSLNQDGGTDDVAIAANMEGFPTDALTVEIAFSSSATDVGAGAPLFSYAASNGSDNEALLFLEGSSGKLVVYLAGQAFRTTVANADLLDGEQHQVSFSWDQLSNELKVYVDGGLEFGTSVNIRDLKSGGTLALGQEQDAEGGKFDSTQTFKGEITEVRIFDYARNATEIADHAGRVIDDPETEPGLVNNWVMHGESSGAVADLVGVDHLQLQNGAAIVDSEHGGGALVAEETPGAIVGTLYAIDPVTRAPVTEFIIVGEAEKLFEIVGDQLRVKADAALDYETAPSHDVTIIAVGSGGETSELVVNVAVVDTEEYNLITGTDGADTLRGGAGMDHIYGGDGDDNIKGNAGADRLYGGAGDDLIYADAEDTVIDGGDGFDRVVVQGKGDFAIDMAASRVERVDGAGGDDVIDASAMSEAVVQNGKGGKDTLIGGAGDDIQRGGGGADVIYGNDGADTIYGNAGADKLYGGAGDDVIYADAADKVIDGGDGYDRVIAQGADDFKIDMAAAHVERVDSAGGNDTIDASGMKEAVRQNGNAGDDTLIGGAGDDIQRGGDGNDVLYGNDGADNMRGGAGDDFLHGGAGDDYVYGENGSDVFVYEMGDGSDRIYGGSGGGWTDTIQLDPSNGDFGEFNVDWTLKLTQGSLESADAHNLVFSDDAHGIITLHDGSTITFADIEQVTF